VAVDRQGDAATELAVAMLIEDGTVRRHLRRMRRIYAARRDALAHALAKRLGDRVRFQVPAGGLALWVEADLDVERWAEDSLAEGVGFETGRRFLLEGGPTRHVRLGFASLGERELERAMVVLQRTANRQR
jgi:GntR family transcriptional regulator/MocR family aminotransferase